MTTPVSDRTIGAYLESLASSAPAPGGGSVAGIVAGLAMCLGRMVVSLSPEDEGLRAANTRLEEATKQSIAASEADERAYGGYVAASKLPKSTPEEKKHRREAMQTALRDAAETPMLLAELLSEMKSELHIIADRGNSHVVSDAAAALLLADAAIGICRINVGVNLPYLKDTGYVASLESRLEALA
jgi:formiminotetrahydrofolate cyclodeaminase